MLTRAAAPSWRQRRRLVLSRQTSEREVVGLALVEADEGVFGLPFLPRPEERYDGGRLQLGQDLEERPGRQRGGAPRRRR